MNTGNIHVSGSQNSFISFYRKINSTKIQSYYFYSAIDHSVNTSIINVENYNERPYYFERDSDTLQTSIQ